MRWLIASIVVGFFFPITFANAQPNEAEGSVILSSGCAKFHIVLGRIHLDPHHYKKVRLSEPLGKDTDDEEFVCVTARGGVPSVHYMRSEGERKVTIDVMDVRATRIEMRMTHPSGVRETLLIDQRACGPLRVVSALGERQQEFESASLWHFVVEEPLIYEQQVAPILGLIFRRFDAPAFVLEVQNRMQALTIDNPPANEDHLGPVEPRISKQMIEELVGQLASAQSTQRSKAKQALNRLGLAALPVISQLDLTTLDAEQRLGVAALKQRLNQNRSDSPARVARWLSTDHDFWTTITKNWPTDQQTAASEYLVATLGKGLNISAVTGSKIASEGGLNPAVRVARAER